MASKVWRWRLAITPQDFHDDLALRVSSFKMAMRLRNLIQRGRELDGEVTQSVLSGDMLCKYVIYLPDEVLKKYT